MSDANDSAALLDPRAASAVQALIALIADPKASAARLAELQRASAEIDKAKAELEADRAAFADEMRAERAELDAQRKKAAGAWKTAQEAGSAAAGLKERAEAYAAKVGYFEKPTHMAIGTSGIGMVIFDDAPAQPPPAAPAPETINESFCNGLTGGQVVARRKRG